MLSIESCPLPDNALLDRYRRDGAFTDCYTTEISGVVRQPQLVLAFYTTAVFKLERLILKWAVSKPSTDVQAAQLAEGSIDAFAAWQVEARTENQLLMRDTYGRTRSWLMVVPIPHGSGARTRLYFGSAVVPEKNPKTGRSRPGLVFRALLGFHKLYSVVLLYSARSSLETRGS